MFTDRESLSAPSRALTGDEIVISGISGIFPKSRSTQQFMENLYNKVDMVTKEGLRWNIDHPQIPKHFGVVDGLDRFDAQFFKVHYKQAFVLDPLCKKLLESTYGVIYDAGINPLQLRGKKIGVFIGAAISEFEEIGLYGLDHKNGFGITGCNRSMYANRISYWLDINGPSHTFDVSSASSMACLEHAYNSIRTGKCEAAIVGGCNVCIHPNVALNMAKHGVLCFDGKTKCFDKNGDGTVRSDAIGVLFFQKAKEAKRIYCEVYHANSNYCGNINDRFLPNRHSEDIRKFLDTFYSKIDVSPRDVEYIEAFGFALAEADGNELKAIGKIFATDKVIKVGSVNSNMGHSEPASGVCSIIKLCLAYHRGLLPGNLHYNNPLDHIPAVQEKKIQVVTDNEPFGRGLTALNSFSNGGVNIHALLKGHYKPKDPERYKSSIPRIVLMSARQDERMKSIINKLNNQPIDYEQIGLIHDFHEINITGHTCRGYTILESNNNNETVCLAKEVNYIDGITRSVWFVYSGMGSQWATMGAELMRIPIFAAAIERCHRVLKPKGINLQEILTSPDKTIYDNILHSFVGIAAVQIGLTDILREMGIVPDHIIGHSVGELGCAYADGCFTTEEMILSSYSRGLVSIQTPFIRGTMAAVGLGYKMVKNLCPPEIEVACHNSSDSSTISGPADVMKKFIEELTSRDIFAKEVPCSNIAYHSRYIAEAGPGLQKYLSEVIKNPKERSKKWVSTSVPQDKWDEPAAQYSSAEYHTNNLLNPVLFEETSKLIPANAIVIEIAPHGLLQAILKRSLTECAHIPLTKRGHADPVKYFLEAIGKLHLVGLNPKVKVLYPKVEYPVSTETALLSHLVEWEHSEVWSKTKFSAKERIKSVSRDFIMSIHDDDYKCFEGYKRNNSYIFPEAAILILTWETLAMYYGINYENTSVTFTQINFLEEAEIKFDDSFKLEIMINKGSNYFEITHNQTTITTGFIRFIKTVFLPKSTKSVDKNGGLLSTQDIYQILRMRGYSYKGKFQSIHSITSDYTAANIIYTEEWIVLLDSLLQSNVLKRNYAGISTVKRINKLTIDIKKHKTVQKVKVDAIVCLNTELCDVRGITRCGGIVIDTITYNDKPIAETAPDVLHEYTFVPHFLQGRIDLKSALHVNLQIVADNTNQNIKIIEVLSTEYPQISNAIKEVNDEILDTKFSLNNKASKNTDLNTLSVVDNLLEDNKKVEALFDLLHEKSFILAIEKDSVIINPNKNLFNVITNMRVQNYPLVIVLLYKPVSRASGNITYVPIPYNSNFSWVPQVRMELESPRNVVLVSKYRPYHEVTGVIKKLREDYKDKVSLVIVDKNDVDNFYQKNDGFLDWLDNKLTINVLKEGQWGGYYYIPNVKSSKISHFTLTSAVPGDLDSLKWVEALAVPTKKNKMNQVQICFVGLSIDDTKKAVGSSPEPSKAFGMEFSGSDMNGKRVMGLVSEGALSTTVEADPALLWPLPEHWSLEDAATVPLAYVHAYYCLAIISRWFEPTSVLVNNALEPFGQAIIALVLSMGFSVYATVKDTQKKEYLLRLFPQLNDKNVCCYYNDLTNIMMISRLGKKRCDLVVNCASGELRESAMKCVGSDGYILDVSDFDMIGNKVFGMSYIRNCRNYKAVRLSSIFKPEHAHEKKMLQIMMAEGIAKGVVRPLNRLVFSSVDVSRAFRLITVHGEKVLIKMKDSQSSSEQLDVMPRLTCSPEGTYIVICDESGLGIEVADHLVRRGARKLVVHLKSNTLVGYRNTKFESWKKLNVSIKVSSANLLTDKGCVNLLKEDAKMMTVLGIFIVMNENVENKKVILELDHIENGFDKTGSIVAKLDSTSRNLCSNLKYFVVINYSPIGNSDENAISVIENICATRKKLCLPVLVFRTYSIFEFDDNLEKENEKIQPQKLTTVMNALETSLKLNYSNVVTYDLKKRNHADILEKIAEILGINNQYFENIKEQLTLSSLSANDISLEQIKTLFKDKYIRMSPEQEAQLVHSLKTLSRGIKKPNNKFYSGLGAFYAYIDEDECRAAEPVIQMPTKLSNIQKDERELDPKETYLMLIPGFEGHHQIFTKLCERLKVEALTFQLGPDMMEDSIHDMAVNIRKFIKKRFQLQSKFYLLGYSFGINIALELAALFEKEGHLGVVYCLDSSPEALKVQLDAYVGNLTDIELQNNIMEHMYTLMTGRSSEEVKNDLKKVKSWTEKIEICVGKLRRFVSYSNEYKSTILQGAYRRIMLAKQYEPNFKLNSQLVLIKGISHPRADFLADDYSLSKYTTQPLIVQYIESDHALAPYDCRVSNIVNKFLDPTLLSEFKNKDLCETYFGKMSKTDGVVAV